MFRSMEEIQAENTIKEAKERVKAREFEMKTFYKAELHK